jgi:transposase-like protein
MRSTDSSRAGVCPKHNIKDLLFPRRKRVQERGTRMEQLRLLVLETEQAVRIELDESLREELVALMAAAIVAIHQAEREAGDE